MLTQDVALHPFEGDQSCGCSSPIYTNIPILDGGAVLADKKLSS